MGCGLAQGNGAHRLAIVGIGQMHHATVEPAEHVDALLAVGFAIVFLAHHGPVENRIGTDKVVTVFDNVAAALAVRPGEYM